MLILPRWKIELIPEYFKNLFYLLLESIQRLFRLIAAKPKSFVKIFLFLAKSLLVARNSIVPTNTILHNYLRQTRGEKVKIISKNRFLGRAYVMRTLIIIGLLSLINLGLAQSNDNPLEVTLEAFIVSTVTQEDGSQEEVFEAAEQARPGQIVEYRVVAQNTSDVTLPANSAVIVGPVPAGTAYIDGTASQLDNTLLSFSADGGQSFSTPPVMITVTNEDGEEEEVEADPEQYTTTRWEITKSLEPNEGMTFIYRVVVK